VIIIYGHVRFRLERLSFISDSLTAVTDAVRCNQYLAFYARQLYR